MSLRILLRVFLSQRYVTYNSWLCENSLAAVRILICVSQSALVQPKLVDLFTATEVKHRLHVLKDS